MIGFLINKLSCNTNNLYKLLSSNQDQWNIQMGLHLMFPHHQFCSCGLKKFWELGSSCTVVGNLFTTALTTLVKVHIIFIHINFFPLWGPGGPHENCSVVNFSTFIINSYLLSKFFKFLWVQLGFQGPVLLLQHHAVLPLSIQLASQLNNVSSDILMVLFKYNMNLPLIINVRCKLIFNAYVNFFARGYISILSCHCQVS